MPIIENREPRKILTTDQFAEEILDNPNKIFTLFTSPNDEYCFFLASVNLFGTQTILINAGKHIGNGFASVPGYTHAFSISCYDAALGICYDREECICDIGTGLNNFEGLQGMNNSAWYIVNDGEKSRLYMIYG